MNSIGDSGVVRLSVVCGPTAAGKSALALALADSADGAIVSADSRQVYRGFDIGTAKPTPAERSTVPHFGVDVAEPRERYSAGAWAAAAPGWLADAERLGRKPLVVGGTGFYLRALFMPLFEAPALESPRRESLARYLGTLSRAELQRWCGALDPTRATLGTTQLMRAIETALLHGQRISDLHRERARAPGYVARYLLVDPGRALAEQITTRVDRMIAAGWVDEVRVLAERVPADAPAWTATGYDVLRDVVTGMRTLDDARACIIMRTNQYAKRQRTWFRHQLPAGSALRIDPHAPGAAERALAWWNEES